MNESKRRNSAIKSGSQAQHRIAAVTAASVNRIKILSMGPPQVGKSCLIKRYCEERFISKYIATIGIDYGVKPVEVDGSTVKVNFWDLSGYPEFLEIRNEFYRDTQGVLLVYDVSVRESFTELDGWIAEAVKYGANLREVPTALCANKIDKKRVITEEEGRAYALSRGFQYFETSAQSGVCVTDLFEWLFQTVTRKVRV